MTTAPDSAPAGPALLLDLGAELVGRGDQAEVVAALAALEAECPGATTRLQAALTARLVRQATTARTTGAIQ